MVYLDNAATEYVADYTTWMNLNAKYAHKSKSKYGECVERMMKLLNVHSGMIVFGGQNATQLLDLLHYRTLLDLNWAVSKYEHNSINDLGWAFNEYEEIYMHPKQMICHMLVNNITGAVYTDKCREVGLQCYKNNQFFLMDCSAAIGHIYLPNDLEEWCDCLVMSGHKFGGGYMGCMWLSERLCLELGIKTASDLAGGTPNVMGVNNFVTAFEIALRDTDLYMERFSTLLDALDDKLIDMGVKYRRIDTEYTTYAINAIQLYGINADALQNYLSTKGIYIGRGTSACDSNDDSFRVLRAYGLSKDVANQVVRISFNPWNTIEDVEALCDGIKEFKEKFCK